MTEFVIFFPNETFDLVCLNAFLRFRGIELSFGA